MSIVNEKPQLDLVLALPGATGQEIEQKDRNNDSLKIYRCFKEFETSDFETLNPKMKPYIQPGVYSNSSNASTLSGKICKVNQLTESYSVITGRASNLRSCPKAPENRD